VDTVKKAWSFNNIVTKFFKYLQSDLT